MMTNLKMLFWYGAFGAVCLAAPVVHAVVLVANLVLQTILLVGQWVSARLPVKNPVRRAFADEQAMVSIHVPAYNEPPEVLSQTLRSLANLDWDNYEVLVIDNNTQEEAVWRPSERLCEELGPRFKFFHVDRLSGFKAGAMNYVRRRMHRRADFVLVVDADYQLEPDAIRQALRYDTDPKIGLLQFPQHYRNASKGNRGVVLDFEHFFSCYMRMANRLACVPSTGTLTFIRTRALVEVGGFDEEAITEDAEIGLRLTLAGHRNLYLHEVIGHGLLPFDLASLKKQRWRWAFGNVQILKRSFSKLLFSPQLSWRQRLGFLVHLSAWSNFNLIPSLSLLLLAPLAWLNWISPLQVYLLVIAGLTLMTFVLAKAGVFFLTLRRDGYSLREIAEAFVSHLGLGMIFSTAWMKCLVNDREPFLRTNKFLSQRIPGVLSVAVTETALGGLLLLSGLALFAADFVLAPVAALLMAGACLSVHWLGIQMRKTRELTADEAGVDDLTGEAGLSASDLDLASSVGAARS